MRISIQHTETFRYQTPSMGTIQVLRMTPRDHTGHYVCDWSVDVDADCKLETSKDAFGNILSSFSLSGPLETLTITATGEVETEETHGIIRGTAEKVPDGVFLRPSHNEAQAALARTLMQAAGDAPTGSKAKPLEHMHTLMGVLHAALPVSQDQGAEASEEQRQQQAAQLQAQESAEANARASAQAVTNGQQMGEQSATNPDNPALSKLAALLAERPAFDASQAATLFCDTARRYGLPARLVAGYRLLEELDHHRTRPDIWAEVNVESLGWVAFDPIHKNCPSEESVRVAVGLDSTGIHTTRMGQYGSAADFNQETSIAVHQIRG